MGRRLKRLIKKQWLDKFIGGALGKFEIAIFAAVFGLVGVAILLSAHALTLTASFETENGTLSGTASTVTDATASGGHAVKFGSGSTGACTNANVTVSALLVPSCGVWLGGFANDHPGVSSFKDRILDLESREGRQLSFVHTYHSPTGTSFSSDELFFINRANTYLLVNYKPTTTWSQGDGSDSTVNAQIDALATSIKAVAPHKIMLVIAHEPENDVSSGASNCPSNVYASGASAGTPAQYRAMWANVRARFDAKSVTNVVWAVNFMSFQKFDCMKDDLWPGNSLVDWVLYDNYPGDGETWASSIGRFYTWMTQNSDSTHNYVSKPWGLAEWGDKSSTQADAYKLYADGAQAIINGDMPNLKLYTIFDAIGVSDSRIDYSHATDQPDPVELQDYQAFAGSSGFVQP